MSALPPPTARRAVPGTPGSGRPRGVSRLTRVTDVALGVLYLALAGALVVTAVLVYDQTFTGRVEVQLQTGTVGNNLRPGADVKVRGVVVGRVQQVDATTGGARLTLDLQPVEAERIPSGVTARLLPKTLFGERYVDLQVPGGTGGSTVADPLADGDVIRQDTSQRAAELEDLFDKLLPALTAVQPDKLSATLGELVALLRGRGQEIGDVMEQWSAYVQKLNPEVPQLAADLGALGRVASDYSEALPDLLTALEDFSVTSTTLVEERDQLRTVIAGVIGAADDSERWLSANESTIRVLSASSRDALRAVGPYAWQFPCLFASARAYGPAMAQALGAGTGQPGLRVEVQVVPPANPTVTPSREPHCPYVPAGIGDAPGSSAPRGPGGSGGAGGAGSGGDPGTLQGLGPINSPEENQMTAEIFSGTLGVAPDAFPSWGTLVLGPLARGADVVLR